MGKVVVITSGKGGVGKTTVTANLGTAMALSGKKVVLVDTDIGLRNLDVVLGLENRIVYDIVDVVDGRCRLEQALIKDKRNKNLLLLPAAQTRDKTAINEEEMKKLLDTLKKEQDYVFIDSPAGIEFGFRNAIAGADEAIVVTTPEVAAIRDADRVIGLLESHDLREPRVIINRIRADMVRRGDMMSIDDMIEILAVNLLGIIPEDESIIISTNRGEPIVLQEKSQTGQAFRNLARRLEGEKLPVLELGKEKLVDKIKRMIGIS